MIATTAQAPLETGWAWTGLRTPDRRAREILSAGPAWWQDWAPEQAALRQRPDEPGLRLARPRGSKNIADPSIREEGTFMYYMLTNRELTILQNILFEGAGNAFLVASGNGPELDSAESHRAINKEVAHLFIEAVMELIGRLEHTQLGADGTHISTDSPAVDQLACFSSHLRVILQEPLAG